MKAILISIRPEWVAKILNGEKTIEIRKTTSKCDLPIDVYIYCTKSKGLVEYSIDGNLYFDEKGAFFDTVIHHDKKTLNGKVVAKFTLEEIELLPMTRTERLDEICEESCMDLDDLLYYFYPNYKQGYAWHISDLQIFDEPKEITEFHTGPYPEDVVVRAPQSWMYVEVLKTL